MGFLDSILSAISSLFGQQKQPVNVYQPTYGGPAVGTGTTNIPMQRIAAGSSKPRPVVRAKRDFNPQFPSRSDLALAIRLNPDPRHLIPHMYAQEGTAIKYVDIRGGSNTVSVAELKKRKGIK